MDKVLEQVGLSIEETEAVFNEVLEPFSLSIADKVVAEFQQAVSELGSRSMEDSVVSSFHARVASEIYRLGTALARQGLRSTVVKIHGEQINSKEFLSAVPPADGKKLTREDKAAAANLRTLNEQQITAIYEKATQAIEMRVWGLKDVAKVIEAINFQNMAEKKMVTRDVQ